jgi:flagellar motor switch protein FliM
VEKILSQEEIDALLKGMSGGEVETETELPAETVETKTYDLTKQRGVTLGRMPGLEVINFRFAKLLRNSLSASMRRDADVIPSSVEVVKFEEFTKSLPVPTSLHICKLNPLRGYIVINIASKLAFTFVDILLGGDGKKHMKVEGRDFTSIESRLIQKMVFMALEAMEKSWHSLYPIQAEYHRSEINPHFAGIVAPSETVILIKFSVDIGEIEEQISLCIPYSVLEPVQEKLSSSFYDLEVDHAWIKRLEQGLRHTEVMLSVELGYASIKGKDLANLNIGDIITLDRTVSDAVILKVEGVPKYRGHAGVLKGNKAFQVTDKIS